MAVLPVVFGPCEKVTPTTSRVSFLGHTYTVKHVPGWGANFNYSHLRHHSYVKVSFT